MIPRMGAPTIATTRPAQAHRPPVPARQQRRRVQRLLEELGIGPGRERVLRHGDLAGALGVHRTHWSKIVNGERLPVSGHPFGRWGTWAAFEADVRSAADKLQRQSGGGHRG